ncbi:molybdopterin molybdotransferase MoeA [Frigoriglobus tundricola]|uniref:Molybdopterin molybdenumtransferase n=1 Tax=Frigoriglobus tundricola TaxID=2774151 RepID=A0A6M5YST1_9BACT|nr:gephyrin-like molybdotransferase Glp [Frigoriglobus tundricola]QJW96919.1 Molybdopterin molybdenumtransferase [Frigoriglobus tundricola]
MLEVADALAEVLKHARPLETETVALAPAALGHVLAADIAADIDSPPFPKSLRDGYAVRSADCAAPGAELKVVAEIPAGVVPTRSVGAGEACRIFTGAPLPEGADAVVMQEDAQALGDRVRITDAAVKPRQHVYARGTEMRVGAVVLRAGTPINPAAFGVLANVGKTAVPVYPFPRVGVVATGDELVEAGTKPDPGRIRNTNGPMLTALTARGGGRPRYFGIARDARASARSLIQEGLDASDVLLIAGGVSVGDFDLVPAVLAELGVTFHVRQVRMKPGKPLLFGTAPAGQLVFGLPGNPVSTFVCFELFVRPALRILGGHAEAGPRTIRLPVAQGLAESNDRPTYRPAKLEYGPDGLSVRPLAWSGAPDLVGLQPADALIVLPAGDTRCDCGANMDVVLLG